MTDVPNDPNPGLRAELLAALAVLALGGLHDLAQVSMSDDLRADIRDQITGRERRRDLIMAVLVALDAVIEAWEALIADGYPLLPPMPLPEDLYLELQAELAEILAAIASFQRLTRPETGDFNPESSTDAHLMSSQVQPKDGVKENE